MEFHATCKNDRRWELSSTAGGSANWYIYFGKLWQHPLELGICLPSGPVSSLPCVRGGLVPKPPWMPKSADVQVPDVKWHTLWSYLCKVYMNLISGHVGKGVRGTSPLGRRGRQQLDGGLGSSWHTEDVLSRSDLCVLWTLIELHTHDLCTFLYLSYISITKLHQTNKTKLCGKVFNRNNLQKVPSEKSKL